jgi:hypothetical protein
LRGQKFRKEVLVDKIIMQVVLLHLLLRMVAERHSIQLPSISLSSSSFLMQIILGIFIALLELVVFFNNVLGQKVLYGTFSQ